MAKETNSDLELQREQFIANLLESPIENEEFTAVFSSNSPHSGDLIFYSKIEEREARVKWGVPIIDGKIKVRLSIVGGYKKFETDAENFRQQLEDDFVILNLFADKDYFKKEKD